MYQDVNKNVLDLLEVLRILLIVQGHIIFFKKNFSLQNNIRVIFNINLVLNIKQKLFKLC